jgi:uncharacterized iron-regulated membrane protein
MLPAAVPLAGDRELRQVMRPAAGLAVLTGGQTGVDTEAALAALSAGLVTHLVFPRGYRQEDGPLSQARRQALRGAASYELSLPEFRYRTWTCVYLADAVILLDPAGGEGCQQTRLAARSIGRPLLESPASLDTGRLLGWLRRTRARTLMVAGCRGSQLATVGLAAQVRLDVTVIATAARQRHDELAS